MGTTPQKLADWLQDKTIYLWDSGDEQYYASPICEDIVPMLRQQALEIQALHQILGYEGIKVGNEYLAECVADLRKAQEK